MAKQASKITKPPVIGLLVADDSQAALRFAGAGFLSDLAKMAFAEGKTMTLSADDAALCGAGFVPDMCRQVANEAAGGEVAPTLTMLTPDTAVLGSADIVMTCTGTGFSADSVINFAGQVEPVTFVSDTEISTGVKPSLGWGAGPQPVFVRNGLLQSETLQFTFTDTIANVSANR